METIQPQTFQVQKITVNIFQDKNTLGAAAAAFISARLQEVLAARGTATIILATGASQYEFLDAMRTIQDVDWKHVTAFHLDEYIDIPAHHPASFRRYLKERVFTYLPFGCVHLLEGDALDPAEEARRYAALLQDSEIDLACIGIGENGHLAFNDPPADFETQELVHIQALDMATRRQQVGEGHFIRVENVPDRALTLSIPAILRARTISCVTPDLRKARAVQAALEAPLSPDCPASALRLHTDCHIFLDTLSASSLSTAVL